MRPLLHKGRAVFWGLLSILFVSACCTLAAAPEPNRTDPTDSEARAQTVRSITLPHFEPDLPVAPGRDDYLVVCVSCHSPRYVMMQPFFPQAKWEETVDKMAKVYGARMDPEQRTAIVQYLVATHGPDSKRASAPDDDTDFGPVAVPAARAESAPSLTLAPEASGQVKQIERGAELFKRECSGCHGTTGQGDGFIAPVLLRKPKDLATTRYSLTLLSQVIWNGKRGTAMPAWRTLPQPDLSALAAYVQSLHKPVSGEDVSSEPLQRGNQVFQQNCTPCHGAAGDGKGTSAATLIPEPANFKLKQPDQDYILQVLNNGIPGTGMPAWNKQIPAPDRKALADFVRSLFRPADN